MRVVRKFLIDWCARRDYLRCALTPAGRPSGAQRRSGAVRQAVRRGLVTKPELTEVDKALKQFGGING
jgi:DNA-nicking Smr family endonuclease